MILKVTDEEVKELQRAVTQMHREILRRLTDAAGGGYSVRHMQLCGRRARLEALLKRLDFPLELAPMARAVDSNQLAEAA